MNIDEFIPSFKNFSEELGKFFKKRPQKEGDILKTYKKNVLKPNSCSSLLKKVYINSVPLIAKFPDKKNEILEICEIGAAHSNNEGDSLGKLYKNLEYMAEIFPKNIDDILKIFKIGVSHLKNDGYSLGIMFCVFGNIVKKIPQKIDDILEICKIGVAHPNNDELSLAQNYCNLNYWLKKFPDKKNDILEICKIGAKHPNNDIFSLNSLCDCLGQIDQICLSTDKSDEVSVVILDVFDKIALHPGCKSDTLSYLYYSFEGMEDRHPKKIKEILKICKKLANVPSNDSNSLHVLYNSLESMVKSPFVQMDDILEICKIGISKNNNFDDFIRTSDVLLQILSKDKNYSNKVFPLMQNIDKSLREFSHQNRDTAYENSLQDIADKQFIRFMNLSRETLSEENLSKLTLHQNKLRNSLRNQQSSCLYNCDLRSR